MADELDRNPEDELTKGTDDLRKGSGPTLRSIMLIGALIVIGFVGWRMWLDGRAESTRTSADESAVPNQLVPTEESISSEPSPEGLLAGLAKSDERPGPGAGAVVGRLIDSVSGLPIVDAGVTLRDRGRRAISGPGGVFRFDGVDGQEVSLIIGPAEGYLPRGLTFRMRSDGADLGLIALAKADPATPIDPAYGGIVAGCGPTRLSLAVGAFDVQRLVRVTCVENATALPLDPPIGRLPLAVVDLAPSDAPLAFSADLRVGLPSQPRFAEGVALDLFRFDLDLLSWIPSGTLLVDPVGGTASGRVEVLGTYLVAAPPFGSFDVDAGDAPTIASYSVAAEPNGAPVNVFPADTYVAFGAFDYAGMENTPILVRTTDPSGIVIYESLRPYTGSGHDVVPMIVLNGNRAWPIGNYDTTWYVGDPPRSVGRSITWRVQGQPTPAPTPTLTPPPPPDMTTASADSTWSQGGFLAAKPLAPSRCVKPLYWYDYPIKAGETLTAIARNTGTTASVLAAANCLDVPAIRADEILWVPKVPRTNPAPYIPKPAPPTPGAGPDPVATFPAGGSEVYPTKQPAPFATLAIRPTDPAPPPPPPAAAPPADGGGVQGGPVQGRGAPPPAQPSPVPPKDPEPSEPTLAPRPTPPPAP